MISMSIKRVLSLRLVTLFPVAFFSVSLPLFFSATTSFFLISCSTIEKNSDTAEGAFAIAQEFDKDERYDVAIQKYQDVKNKYPYSQFATKSELAIADVYFKQESYAEAQVSYQAFRDLHPKHPQIDYIIYRTAMSFYHQVPETVDRDLSLANDAITNFKEIEEKYAKSEYAKESEDKHVELVKKLAGKEEYIADFYLKHEIWESAAGRYEGILRKYPHLGLDEKALSRAAICVYKLGDASKAQKILAELESKFPNSKEIAPAKKVIR